MTRLHETRSPGFHPAIFSTALPGRLPLSYVIGTGSSGPAAIQQVYEMVVLVAKEPSVADRLAEIRHYLFQMSVNDFAKVMGVERPTIYAWLDGSSTPRRANLERIEKLHSVAMRWKEMSGKALGRLLHEQLRGETKTLLDLLSGEIDMQEVERMLERLAHRQREKEAMSVDARRKALGFPDLTEEQKAANLAWNMLRFARRK